MKNNIEWIVDGTRHLALIVPADFPAHPLISKHGDSDRNHVRFFTPDEFSQQIGIQYRPKGWVIDPHVHRPVRREVHLTQEVIFIRKGVLRVDFYTSERVYLKSRVLRAGDVVLLIEGGHGFTAVEPCEILEVKQGPYAGDKDKQRFKSPRAPELNFK